MGERGENLAELMRRKRKKGTERAQREALEKGFPAKTLYRRGKKRVALIEGKKEDWRRP